PLAVPVDDDRGAELLVRTHATAQRVGERLCERNRVALDRDIDVEAALSEQDVTHSPTDEIHALEVAAQGGDGLEDRLEPLQLRELVGQREGRATGRRGTLAERLEHVGPGDDADQLAVAQNRDALVAAREQPLKLRERRVLVAYGDT